MPYTERAFELLDDNRWDDRHETETPSCGCCVCGVVRADEATEHGPDADAPLCWYCARPVVEDGYCSSVCEASAQRESEGNE